MHWIFILSRFYYVKEDDCLADLDSSLDYSTLFGLFLILVAGVASAILMLSLELAGGAVMRGRRRRSRNRGDIFRLKSVSHGEGGLMTELERLRMKVEEQEEMIRSDHANITCQSKSVTFHTSVSCLN